MIHGYLNNTDRYEALLQGGIWSEAFQAIRNLRPDSPLGITELRGPKLFINVHTYDTLPETSCKWESHRHTIDLQYVISGSECVGVAALADLGEATGYREEKDTLNYAAGPAESILRMSAGSWVIFFPEDPHKPKISSGKDSSVLKAVVKIDTSLFD